MPAVYQDENGKWYKQCSTTKEVFGPVDNKEDLSQWFSKGDGKDGFRSYCKEVDNKRQQKYNQENLDKIKEKDRKYYQKNVDKIREKIKEYRKQYYQKNKKQIQKQHLEYNHKKIENTTFIRRQHGTKKIIQSFTADDIQKLVYESTSIYNLLPKLGYSTDSCWVIPKIKNFIEYNNIQCKWSRRNTFNQKDYDKQYHGSAKGLYSHYKRSAKKRKINFTLTIEWLEEQIKSGKTDICSVTGEKFVLNQKNHPFSRSLDRISSTKGYTPDNVRWVCFKYNAWKSDLTLEDIARIFKYTAQSHNLDPHEILNQVS